MNNGQMNVTSTFTAMPLTAQKASAAVAVTKEGAAQGDSDFAGLLSGLQALAQTNAPTDAHQSEQGQSEKIVSLIPVAPEETDDSGNVLPQGGELSSITSQMVLAAYAQLGRTPEIVVQANKPAAVVVDMQQNAAMATEQPAVKAAATATAVVTQSTPVTAQTAPTEVKPETPARTVEVNKPAAVVVDMQQNAAMATEQPAVKAAPPSELELEIQLSQPLPITPRTAAAPAATATLLNETRTTRLHPGSDPQTEKVRTAADATAVKEVTSALLTDVSGSLGSESSNGSDTDQGQPDGANDNPDTTQHLPGQLLVESQKVTAVMSKSATTEPLGNDVPEQVMQQVKERLDQHDIKQGKQQMTLTLSPENLGEIKMNLNLQGQKLSIEIVAENRSVRDAILQHVDTLKETLARQNITMESFDVTTGGKGSGNQGQNQNAWRELTKQQQQQQFWTSPRGYATAQADLPSEQALQQRRQGQSMLDIHY
jgi:flagellar hook-length control protein FliK